MGNWIQVGIPFKLSSVLKFKMAALLIQSERAACDSFACFFSFSFSVFVCDIGKHCFVWIGSKASIDERRKAFK